MSHGVSAAIKDNCARQDNLQVEQISGDIFAYRYTGERARGWWKTIETNAWDLSINIRRACDSGIRNP